MPPVKPRGPLALGIVCAHDAAVAVCSPDGVLFSVQEERLSRIKHHYGFPYKALEAAFKYCGLSPRDVSVVAFPSRVVYYPEHGRSLSVAADGTRGRGPWSSRLLAALPRAFSGGVSPGTRLLRRRVRKTWGQFADRHWTWAFERLRDMGLMDGKVPYYHVAHHRAHAASAFRLGGRPEACVVTMDGKGDGLAATTYKGHPDGRLELLRSTPARDSLGSFYQAATEALGFIPVDGEYKTMGLAALGRAGGANPFDGTVRTEDGVFKSRIGWTFRDFNEHNPGMAVPNPLGSVAQAEAFKPILAGMSREQFAYHVQDHCESNMADYFRDAMRLAGSKHLACAGGVMLNVKANALIADRLRPDSFFVFPDAADSGLAAGAAMEALWQEGHLPQPARYLNPYLGPGFEDDEIDAALAAFPGRSGLKVRAGGPDVAAQALAEGKVLGTFQGRMEVGPRALGNRSVLADPRFPAVKDRINGLLKGREPFVPFAPVLLEEEAARCWDGPADHRYMTFAVQASAFSREKLPAVVHVDGTMRPQVASAEWNPWICEVLRAFKERSGVGVLINTSFNRHGLPIVGSPADALEHLANGWVDAVALGRWFVERV